MKELEIERKQFIAGAVCPECNVLDRLVVEYARTAEGEPLLSRRRCVACGFSDPFSQEGPAQATGAVPRGKPERVRHGEVTAAPVTILDKPADR